MIRKIFFFLFISFTASIASAQHFTAGLLAGVSTSQVSGDQLSGFNKAGVLAGGYVFLQRSDKWSVQFEIVYIEKGSAKRINPAKNDYRYYLLGLNYVEVPLLIKLHYSTKLIFETGPSAGGLINSKEEDEYGVIPNQRAFDRSDIGYNIGLHYIITKNILFNARLSNSVLPIRPHASGQTYLWNRGQYNTVIQFSLRVQFEKQKKEM